MKRILYIASMTLLPITIFATAAQAQQSTLGQSGWTRPGQPSGSSSGLGQSQWVQPAQSAPTALGQSGWVKPGSSGGIPIALKQSGWIQQQDQQMPMMQGSIDQNNYLPPQQSPQFFQQPPAQMGLAPLGSGYQMMENNTLPTDNLGKAMGIASQMGLDMNQCDNTAGGGVGCTNYTQQSNGMRMPYIPGTQLFNRTANRASHTADRALNRVLNRAINSIGR